jgi:hypothetical protein
MWEKNVYPARPHMTTRRMHFVCRVTKSTGTHSEYVIQIVLPLQQWLRERASMLRFTYTACNIYFQNTPCLGTLATAIPFRPATNIRQFPGPIDSPSNTSPPICIPFAEHPVVFIDLQYELLLQHHANLVTSWTRIIHDLISCFALPRVQTTASVRVAHTYSSDWLCGIGFQQSQLESEREHGSNTHFQNVCAVTNTDRTLRRFISVPRR